jgi:hypothetical protein
MANYDAEQFNNEYALREEWILTREGRIESRTTAMNDLGASLHVRRLADGGSAYHKEAIEIHDETVALSNRADAAEYALGTALEWSRADAEGLVPTQDMKEARVELLTRTFEIINNQTI